MKYFISNNKTSFNQIIGLILIVLFASSCVEELPEANSLKDKTPPSAGFSYNSLAGENLTINFSNLSVSATDYSWDFGDGNSSTDKEPKHTYANYDTYTVTLTAKDKLEATSSTTQEVKVEKGPYQPVISEASFEVGQLDDGSGDGRDSWRNSDLGGVIQITSSPVNTGEKAAKLTGSSTDQRIGYQIVTVEKESYYDLNFAYTMLDDQVGFITVSVLSGPVTSHEEAVEATIASLTVNDQEDPATYVPATLSFNSGTSTQVAIYFFNEGTVESRLDDFTIEIGTPAPIPPSVAFTVEQSETNFKEYTFTNASVNAVSYAWDFGDGNTSTDESPTYTYDSVAVFTVSLVATSEERLEAKFTYELDIQDPVYAGFTHAVDPDDYKTYVFADTSVNVVSRVWDFGDGFLSTLENVSHTYSEDGNYTVKLVATSSTGATDEVTEDLVISEGFVVTILNGDFESGTDNWKISAFTDGTTNPFNSSSDGDLFAYNGEATASKTGGAKWTSDTSAGPSKSAATRYAYQAIEVLPNTTYYLEYSYAIIAKTEDINGGDRVIAEVLDGQFADGVDAVASSNDGTGALVSAVGDVANGKGNFAMSKTEFTTTDNKDVSIWIYAITNDVLYIDNVKIYEKE